MSLLGDLLAVIGVSIFGLLSLGLVALCHRLRES
jgi:hypothetical protein